MSKTISKMLSCVLALMVVITGVVPSIGEVSAATTDLKITSVKVVNTETGAVVADLMAGQKPKLIFRRSYEIPIRILLQHLEMGFISSRYRVLHLHRDRLQQLALKNL